MMLSQIQSMTPEQRTQLANAVGVTLEQLTSVAQTMATMPPEMLQQLVAQRMGAAGAPGAAGAASGLPPGVTVVHLTAEEKAAVDRVRCARTAVCASSAVPHVAGVCLCVAAC